MAQLLPHHHTVNVFKVNRNCFLYAKIDAKISEHDSLRRSKRKKAHTHKWEWPTKEKNEHCNYERHTHASREREWEGINWMNKKKPNESRENKMHVIYNRLRLILLPVDGWRHVIFTFGCMQAHQTQERTNDHCARNECARSRLHFCAVETHISQGNGKKHQIEKKYTNVAWVTYSLGKRELNAECSTRWIAIFKIISQSSDR